MVITQPRLNNFINSRTVRQYSEMALPAFLEGKVSGGLFTAFAAVGILFLVIRTFSFVRLLFSCFVLSGKNVRELSTGHFSPVGTHELIDISSFADMARKVLGQLSPVPRTVSEKNTPFNLRRKASISSSSPALNRSSKTSLQKLRRNMQVLPFKSNCSRWISPRIRKGILRN